MEQVGFPLFFGVVTTMVVIPNLLINCVPAADTPLTNASIPLHCSPLKLYFPAFVGLQIPGQETASITRYEHLDSVLVSNITSADSSRRECQFVCLYGTWTGPLCRRMDMLHKSDTNYQPVWQSCYFDPANYVNVSIFYNGFNISESTGNYDTSDWIPKLTVFPHGSRLLLRCEEVGEYIFSGPPVLLCSNGQWDAVPVRAGSNPEKPQSLQPKCEPLSDSVESKENENLIYPPLLTYTAYKGTVAPYYDGRLFVYPGSDLHLGCIYEPRRLGPPKWTWSKSATPDAQMQWTRNLWRNKMEWRLIIKNIKPGDSGKYTCTTPIKSSHSFIVEVTAIDCPRPWDDEHLTSIGTFHFNSTVLFSCSSGYRLIGPSAIFCKLSGEWAQQLPTCVPVNCPPLNATNSRLFIEVNGTFFRARASFSCAPGFRISGNSTAECTENGNWSTNIPFCESVYCPALNVPLNGYAISDLTPKFAVGKIVQFSCNKGFMPTGSGSATCLDDGKWSNPPPRCEPACEPPSAPLHGRVTPAKAAYRVKSHVVYECHGGYRLIGARISYCNPDNKWSSPDVPQCLLDTSGTSSKGRPPQSHTSSVQNMLNVGY